MKILFFLVKLVLVGRISSGSQPTTAIPMEYVTVGPRGPRQRFAERTCRFVNLSAISLFEDSSPCRSTCQRANLRCNMCKKRLGRQKEICLTIHKRKLKICHRCFENPHDLTQIEIERIKSLNALVYDKDLEGVTVSVMPKVRFSLHDINGNSIRNQSGVEARMLFGWTAESKQIPWHIQFINEQADCGGTWCECGGTLVTPNKIVSAAHCFHEYFLPYDWHLENLVARAGNIERKGIGSVVQRRKCSDIITHS